MASRTTRPLVPYCLNRSCCAELRTRQDRADGRCAPCRVAGARPPWVDNATSAEVDEPAWVPSDEGTASLLEALSHTAPAAVMAELRKALRRALLTADAKRLLRDVRYPAAVLCLLPQLAERRGLADAAWGPELDCAGAR